MTDLTPVPWADVEAAAGPPTATEVEEYVAELTSETSGADREAFETVKAVYDEWKADRGEERALSDQAAAFVVASLLEREGAIDLSDTPQGSLVERRPSAERLRERFWEREQTLWWIAVECGSTTRWSRSGSGKRTCHSPSEICRTRRNAVSKPNATNEREYPTASTRVFAVSDGRPNIKIRWL